MNFSLFQFINSLDKLSFFFKLKYYLAVTKYIMNLKIKQRIVQLIKDTININYFLKLKFFASLF